MPRKHRRKDPKRHKKSKQSNRSNNSNELNGLNDSNNNSSSNKEQNTDKFDKLFAVYHTQGRHQDFIKVADNLFLKKPGNNSILFYKGNAIMQIAKQKTDPEESIRLFAQAMECFQKCKDYTTDRELQKNSLYNIATSNKYIYKILIKQGKYQDALIVLELALEDFQFIYKNWALDKGLIKNIAYIGSELFRLSKFCSDQNQEIALLKKSISISNISRKYMPNDPTILNSLGNAYLGLCNLTDNPYKKDELLKRAAASYSAGINSKIKDQNTEFCIQGLFEILRADFASFKDIIKQLLRYYPDNGELNYYYGCLLLEEKKEKIAIKCFKKAKTDDNFRIEADKKIKIAQCVILINNQEYEKASMILLEETKKYEDDTIYSLLASCAEYQHDYKSSEKYWKKAISLAPKNKNIQIQYLYKYAATTFKLGEYKETENILKQALLIQPENIDVLVESILSAYLTKDYKALDIRFDKVLQLTSDLTANITKNQKLLVVEYAVKSLQDRGDYDKSIFLLEKYFLLNEGSLNIDEILEIYSDDKKSAIKVLTFLGTALKDYVGVRHDEFKAKAISCYKIILKTIDNDKENVSILRMIGGSYNDLHQPQEALGYLLRAEKTGIENRKEINFNLAISYLQLRKKSTNKAEEQKNLLLAKKHLQESLKYDPNNIKYIVIMGYTLGSMEDWQESIKCLEKVIDKMAISTPEDIKLRKMALSSMVSSLVNTKESNNIKRSIKYSQESMRLDETNPMPCYMHAQSLFLLDRYSESEKYIKKAINLGFKEISAYYNLIIILTDKGEIDEAEKYIAEMNEIKSNRPECYCAKIYLLIEEEKIEEAEELLTILCKNEQQTDYKIKGDRINILSNIELIQKELLKWKEKNKKDNENLDSSENESKTTVKKILKGLQDVTKFTMGGDEYDRYKQIRKDKYKHKKQQRKEKYWDKESEENESEKEETEHIELKKGGKRYKAVEQMDIDSILSSKVDFGGMDEEIRKRLTKIQTNPTPYMKKGKTGDKVKIVTTDKSSGNSIVQINVAARKVDIRIHITLDKDNNMINCQTVRALHKGDAATNQQLNNELKQSSIPSSSIPGNQLQQVSSR